MINAFSSFFLPHLVCCLTLSPFSVHSAFRVTALLPSSLLFILSDLQSLLGINIFKLFKIKKGRKDKISLRFIPSEYFKLCSFMLRKKDFMLAFKYSIIEIYLNF